MARRGPGSRTVVSRGRRRWFSAVLALCLVASAMASAPGSAAPAQAPEAPEGVVRVEKPPVPDVSGLRAGERLANAAPLSPHTEPTAPDAPLGPIDVARLEAKESGERVEVPAMRSETETTFANPDQTLTTEIASGPIRVDTGGGWVPVDTTLVAEEGVVRPRATANPIVLSPGGGGRPLVSITKPADADRSGSARATRGVVQRVAVGAPGALPAPRLEGNRAVYAGGAGGADLVVDANPVGSEVSVLIAQRPVSPPVYRLSLGVEGLTVRQDAQGGLEFVDDAGVVVGYSPAPIMFDSSPSPGQGLYARQGKVTSTLVTRGDQQVLEVRPDRAFLDDPATVYPVTIDPVTNIYPAADTYVSSANPNQAYDGATRLFAGTNGYTGKTRSFIPMTPGRCEARTCCRRR